MIFVALFSALSLGMLTMSSTNVQVANNHRTANRALMCAQSGLDVSKYWVSRVFMPGDTTASARFDQLASFMHSDMASNAYITSDYTPGASLNVDSVSLDSSGSQSFLTTIEPVDNDTVHVEVTGRDGGITRTVGINYTFGVRQESVFDYGMASRGPVHLSGNIDLNGTKLAVEASVYIESNTDDDALSITGNSQIAGDVIITDPDGTVHLQGGQAGIGGETGQDAIDNHVTTGAPLTEFPTPNTSHFEQYVNGVTIDSDTDTSTDTTFQNVRIAAGTNPHFSGNVTLEGIVFIETPNVVTFAGSTNVMGIIVGDGNMNDNSGTNQIVFLGNVSSQSVSQLPGDSQFDGLHDETGTFLMAPGFSVGFGGSFDTLNGAIAANGINFFGNAGGTIGGSVLNYSDTPMNLSGNSDLYFNRSDITEVPAGFEPEIILHYDSSSYSEVVG
jgi:hypothetical protein